MRVSVFEDNDAFISNSDLNLISIRLNGVVINDCVTADDWAGMVIRYKRDQKGEFILNQNQDGLETYTEYGDVFIDVSRLTQENIDGNQT